MENASDQSVAIGSPLRGYWRTWAAIGVLLAIAYWWTSVWMVRRWEAINSYYSHGWLIPPVSVFLIWTLRAKLAACRIRPERWGLGVLAAGLLMHLVGPVSYTHLTLPTN